MVEFGRRLAMWTVQWCAGIDVERETMEVPAPGSSLNPACELFGFRESDDKNNAAGSQAPFSSISPWNCLCGFCCWDAVKQAGIETLTPKIAERLLLGSWWRQRSVFACGVSLVAYFCKFSNSAEVWSVMFRCLSFKQLRMEPCGCLDPTDLPLKPSQAFWMPECHSHLWGRGELVILVQVWLPLTGTWKASTINTENQTAVVKNFPLVGMLLANDGDKRGLPVKSFPCLINSCVILPLIQSKTLRQHLKACFVWSAAGYRAFPFLFFNKFEANVVGIVSLFSIFWPM